MLNILTKTPKELHPKSGKDEEEEEEEEAQISNLGQGLNHCVQQGSDPFCHLQQLQHWKQ